MKIIDLLNKIANGEEVPKKIKINNIIYEYQGDDYLFKDKNNDNHEYWLFSDGYTDKFEWLDNFLNTEIKIIEEPQEHKIPSNIFLNQTDGNCYIDTYSYKQVPLKREKLSPEEVSIINKINEILDYLEVNNE